MNVSELIDMNCDKISMAYKIVLKIPRRQRKLSVEQDKKETTRDKRYVQ